MRCRGRSVVLCPARITSRMCREILVRRPQVREDELRVVAVACRSLRWVRRARSAGAAAVEAVELSRATSGGAGRRARGPRARLRRDRRGGRRTRVLARAVRGPARVPSVALRVEERGARLDGRAESASGPPCAMVSTRIATRRETGARAAITIGSGCRAEDAMAVALLTATRRETRDARRGEP